MRIRISCNMSGGIDRVRYRIGGNFVIIVIFI